jgi:hypothetical protein
MEFINELAFCLSINARKRDRESVCEREKQKNSYRAIGREKEREKEQRQGHDSIGEKAMVRVRK